MNFHHNFVKIQAFASHRRVIAQPNVCRLSQRTHQRSVQVASQSREEGIFNVSDFFEATVVGVNSSDKSGQVLHLRLHDGSGSILPVYIGEFEGGAITKELQNKKSARPIVYDLFRNTLEAIGSKVTRVCISNLVRNTYHARVHFIGRDNTSQEISIDSRPSDALNLALRFGCPIFVSKEIAYKMACPQTSKGNQGSNELARKCRAELSRHQDPTVFLKLQLELHLKNERYEEARRCQDEIDGLLKSDRLLGLMVSLEAAIDDKRHEEALKYCEQLAQLREQQQLAQQQAQTEAEATGF